MQYDRKTSSLPIPVEHSHPVPVLICHEGVDDAIHMLTSYIQVCVVSAQHALVQQTASTHNLLMQLLMLL